MGSSSRNLPTLRLVRLGVVGLGVVSLGSGLGLWQTAALLARVPDLCLIHRLTGHDCPGCGMGRALLELAQGQLATAFHDHPFAPILAAWAIAWAGLPESVWQRVTKFRFMQSDAPVVLVLLSLVVWWLLAKVA